MTALLGIAGSAGAANGDWENYGRDPGGARFSPLAQITPGNVGRLRQAWIYHMRPPGAAVEFPPMPEGARKRFNTGYAASEASPLVIKGVMYLPTPYRRVIALDAATGRELWVFELPRNDQPSTRGVAYWPGGKGAAPRIVFGTRSGKLFALDAATGKPSAGFGAAGMINMKTPEVMNGSVAAPLGMSSPPSIYHDLIITGSRVQEMPAKGPAGDVRAWDARTGKLVWTFHTVPRPGEPGHDTWEGESWQNRSGTNVWSFTIVDEKRGIAYLPVGAPTFDRWGGDRKGANLFSSSIVAVDANSGKYLWHFQTVHHDIWDLDLPTATLIDVRRDGRIIPAISVMNKTAIMFILDRVTGKPLYDVREVPVPTATDIPSEQPWPTQPMPLAPPPLTRLSFSMDDLNDATPQIKAACQKVVADLAVVESKPFQPLRADSAVNFFPGSLGGVDWGGGAFDPKLGYYIVNVNALASPQQLARQADGSWSMKGDYAYFQDPESGYPCQKGPWGELLAVDVNTGTVAWRRPLGDNEDPAFRDAGRISAGGPITTASGLTFIGATPDKKIRAFDSRTGKLLWAADLPGSNYGMPITYRSKTGRQMVATVATGGFAFSPSTSDQVVAFSLR
ncbi:MAG TPA: pyrroloquinoline quinone-dependent dehydrogenase [Sphingomonas sp.]|nr:pyrroloquinoline quinone-dependent dehydrogenase [Sphingomonas sp.]